MILLCHKMQFPRSRDRQMSDTGYRSIGGAGQPDLKWPQADVHSCATHLSASIRFGSRVDQPYRTVPAHRSTGARSDLGIGVPGLPAPSAEPADLLPRAERRVRFADRQGLECEGQRHGIRDTFSVQSEFLKRYPVRRVGSSLHEELWVPADELADCNRHISGAIEVIASFGTSDDNKSQ
jgi:hypothetical protein